MCGIVGYIGRRKVADVLLNGLKRLEYRGYDSAGIAIVNNSNVWVHKDAGKVKSVTEQIYQRLPQPTDQKALQVGIGHTRWATHGRPTADNAHPHLDQSGRLAIVHNGIVDNHAEIRRLLEEEGCHFRSETDSEVLAHLISRYDRGDLLEAVSSALKQIQGTFGLVILSADHPETLIAARRGSPLIIGLGEGETIVASDAAAIIAHTNQVIYLDDDDVAVVTRDGADIRTIDSIPVSREVASLDWNLSEAEKGPYEHFMVKEIFEQPEALHNSIRGRLDTNQGTALLSGLSMSARELAQVERLTIVACGTSRYAGMVGEYYFEDLAGLPTDVEQAAEFRYRNPIVSPDSMVLAISQSGETADTLAAVREAKQKGALVAGLCNVVGSTIARETGRGVYLHAGPEISVASTKAFTCQIAILLMMALKFGRARRISREAGLQIGDSVRQIPEILSQVLKQNDHIASVAAQYSKARDFFFVGRGILYPVALEGALKLKEISYIHAEGYHAAELKHGPIALLGPDVPIVALANDVPGRKQTLANIQECRAREAPVIAVVTEGDESVIYEATDALVVPRTSPLIAPLTTAVVLQLFAYHVALCRGCEIDQPRNLAKSVTVE